MLLASRSVLFAALLAAGHPALWMGWEVEARVSSPDERPHPLEKQEPRERNRDRHPGLRRSRRSLTTLFPNSTSAAASKEDLGGGEPLLPPLLPPPPLPRTPRRRTPFLPATVEVHGGGGGGGSRAPPMYRARASRSVDGPKALAQPKAQPKAQPCLCSAPPPPPPSYPTRRAHEPNASSTASLASSSRCPACLVCPPSVFQPSTEAKAATATHRRSPGGAPSSRRSASSPPLPVTRVLVSYAFWDDTNDMASTCRSNLATFLARSGFFLNEDKRAAGGGGGGGGGAQETRASSTHGNLNVDLIVSVIGDSPVLLPPRQAHLLGRARIVRAPNLRADLFVHHRALRTYALQTNRSSSSKVGDRGGAGGGSRGPGSGDSYSHFVFTNCGVRGPYFAPACGDRVVTLPTPLPLRRGSTTDGGRGGDRHSLHPLRPPGGGPGGGPGGEPPPLRHMLLPPQTSRPPSPPLFAAPRWLWPFLVRLDSHTLLVGPQISVGPKASGNGNGSAVRRPHVQTHFLVASHLALPFLLDTWAPPAPAAPTAVEKDQAEAAEEKDEAAEEEGGRHPERRVRRRLMVAMDIVWRSEVGLSTAVLDAGFGIASLQLKAQQGGSSSSGSSGSSSRDSRRAQPPPPPRDHGAAASTRVAATTARHTATTALGVRRDGKDEDGTAATAATARRGGQPLLFAALEPGNPNLNFQVPYRLVFVKFNDAWKARMPRTVKSVHAADVSHACLVACP